MAPLCQAGAHYSTAPPGTSLPVGGAPVYGRYEPVSSLHRRINRKAEFDPMYGPAA